MMSKGTRSSSIYEIIYEINPIEIKNFLLLISLRFDDSTGQEFWNLESSLLVSYIWFPTVGE